MAVFVDTGIFVAANNRSDKNHVRASELMRDALEGKYGIIYTSDYVIDEAITTSLARTHDYRIALNIGTYIIDSPRIEKTFTSTTDFIVGWQNFQKLKNKPMSFTDCISLAHIDRRKIERIISFDKEFDGLVARLS